MISYERVSTHTQKCYYCELDLNGTNIFAHKYGGDKHPVHKKCALNLHEAGFDYCIPCCTEGSDIIRCDPLTLHSAWQRPIRKFTKLTLFIAKPGDDFINSRNKLTDLAAVVLILSIPIIAEIAGASDREVKHLSLEASIVLVLAATFNAISEFFFLARHAAKPFRNLEFQ